jgi:putative membrane protein
MRVDRVIWVLAATMALGACGGDDDAETSDLAVDSTAAAPAAAPADAGPTDPQIAAIVVAANTVDIEAGELAKEKGSNAEVKAFAQQMITDHTAVNQQATDLVTKLGVTPEDNPTSQQLTTGGATTKERLSRLSGAEFDKAYIDNEVSYHQTVLDAIDQTLIPSADNGELKSLLQQVRPAIAAHLQHAQQIQSKVAGQ